jgi:protein O-mannosyl-transferase
LARSKKHHKQAFVLAAESAAVDRRGWLYPAFVAIVVLFVSLPTVRNGFVDLDDGPYVSQDGFSRQSVIFAFTSVRPMYWHPMAWLSQELDTEIFGSSPAGHHFTSALLHSLTAGVLFIILTRLGASAVTAVFGSLLWAVHPLRVESFAWVAERKDVLCAIFFLAAVAIYLRYRNNPSRRLYVAWVACGLLALMSKPTAVTLPVILLLVDFWPPRRQASLVRLLVEKLPLFLGAAVITYLAMLGQSEAMALSPVASLPVRAENAAVSYVRYLGKMIWPVNLGCFYPFDPARATRWGIICFALLLAITVFAVVQRKARPWFVIGWCWFVITLLPNAGVVQAGRQALADRFTELPMIGIVIVAVWSASDWVGEVPWRRKFALGGTCALLIALGILTIRQIRFWKDSETLFQRSISVEDSAYIRDNLATNLIQQGRLNEAEFHLLAAIRLAPDEYPHHNNLAYVYGKTGRAQQALEEAKVATRLAPDNYSVAETLALADLEVKDYPAALRNFDHAVQLGSDPTTLAPLLNDTGVSLARDGQTSDAELLFRKAIAYDRLFADAHYNLVHDLAAMGKQYEAQEALKAAIQATGFRPEYKDFIAPANQ